MGQRGPVGKPSELRALEGGRGRDHRPVDLSGIFRPQTGRPAMPRHMSPEGAKAWRRLVPELERYNLVSLVHADALATLCETIGLVNVLRRSLNATQALLVSEGKDPALALQASTPNGMKVQSVTYQCLNRETEKMRTWLSEFGLTPAQQARVSTAVRAQLHLFDANAKNDQKPLDGFAGFE